MLESLSVTIHSIAPERHPLQALCSGVGQKATETEVKVCQREPPQVCDGGVGHVAAVVEVQASQRASGHHRRQAISSELGYPAEVQLLQQGHCFQDFEQTGISQLAVAQVEALQRQTLQVLEPGISDSLAESKVQVGNGQATKELQACVGEVVAGLEAEVGQGEPLEVLQA